MKKYAIILGLLSLLSAPVLAGENTEAEQKRLEQLLLSGTLTQEQERATMERFMALRTARLGDVSDRQLQQNIEENRAALKESNAEGLRMLQEPADEGLGEAAVNPFPAAHNVPAQPAQPSWQQTAAAVVVTWVSWLLGVQPR